MKLDEFVTLGEILELKAGDVTVRTKLQEIVSDSEFVVMQPTFRGVPVRTDEAEVSFTFFRPTGCFSFRARMSAPFRSGELRLCRVERVSEIERDQRRQYYRLPIVLDVMLYEPQTNDEQVPVKWRGKSIDLSEKAMALSCFASFTDGTALMAEIKLSSSQTITLQSTVLRSRPPLRPTDPNELVLLFTDQNERDQHFIRRYIFRQQILNRRKEHDDDNR